jgi:hypothetical protein
MENFTLPDDTLGNEIVADNGLVAIRFRVAQELQNRLTSPPDYSEMPENILNSIRDTLNTTLTNGETPFEVWYHQLRNNRFRIGLVKQYHQNTLSIMQDHGPYIADQLRAKAIRVKEALLEAAHLAPAAGDTGAPGQAPAGAGRKRKSRKSKKSLRRRRRTTRK